MRTIGLLGGMSWQSSIEYERLLNEAVQDHLGGAASADLLIRSYNFAEIEALQEANAWPELGVTLARDAARLEAAGAEAIVLCTNTMHRVADVIEASIGVPLLHIADATAAAVKAENVSSVGVLGTRYTMEGEFYVERLRSHGLDVLTPSEPDRTTIHDIIFNELVRGEITASSRRSYVEVIDRIIARGARGVVAGCTEIELLVGPQDVHVPYFPTTAIHASAAARYCLGQEVT